MGQNMERLGRLQANRSSFIGSAARIAQTVQRSVATQTAGAVSAGVRKAARTTGFEGDLGERIEHKLTQIHASLADFVEYQKALNAAIDKANDALDSTAGGIEGIPDAGLSPAQQSTIDIATQTDSPVQVRPGVTMTPAQAQQYYLDQAAAAQEEQARKMNDALDARLQEIIDGMPTSDYDPTPPADDPMDHDGPGSNTPVGYPGGGSGGGGGEYEGPGIIGPGIDDDGGKDDGNDDGSKTDPPRVTEPPRVEPPVEPPVDPPVYPPQPPETTWPDTDGTDGDNRPRVDGGIDGVTGGGGGSGFPGGVSGTVGGGGGGASGSVGGAGGLVGGAAGGLAGRLGGGGIMGGVGGVGGVAGVGATGAGGASGVVAQSGAANGGRGGMVGGAAAGGGAGGGSDKRNRRRGQGLLAFEVDPEDDQIAPDLGAAGAAGRSASDGREELGW